MYFYTRHGWLAWENIRTRLDLNEVGKEWVSTDMQVIFTCFINLYYICAKFFLHLRYSFLIKTNFVAGSWFILQDFVELQSKSMRRHRCTRYVVLVQESTSLHDVSVRAVEGSVPLDAYIASAVRHYSYIYHSLTIIYYSYPYYS